ncbi:hypothetical protein [Phenylobacterium montanum]|uniref:Uncharacterized protein n=1 Tax=Phenylobacterium montanum TaxID=2823693 RepID=A0A975IUB9_9CAUL|nr:hypothetical protein [Caulobacter sp. S6]QUD87782.1 hypothetical protein KCG34_22500 [Caulobacter sp. S6]
MFVTSDIFDLRQIGWALDVDWRENLICGVDVHGSVWPGIEPAAEFMVAAAKKCGLFEEIRYASYHVPGEDRSRLIKPKSFEKIARGGLQGALGANGLMLDGFREAVGAERNRIAFGGDATGWAPWDRRDYVGEPPAGRQRSLHAHFLFPVQGDPLAVSSELLRLAATSMGAEYGYVFIRDALCRPRGYPMDSSVPPYFAPRGQVCRSEMDNWWGYATRRFWEEKHPLLRDLCQQNLLCERHLSAPVLSFGQLGCWINCEPGRGRLENLGEGRMLWSLTDAEMVAARPILNEAGLLLSCPERVYRDLPGGVAPADRPIPPRIDFRYEDGTKPTYH